MKAWANTWDAIFLWLGIMSIDVLVLAGGLVALLICSLDKQNKSKGFRRAQQVVLWSFIVLMAGLGICATLVR